VSKHGLAIMIADKMPPPGSKGGGAKPDDYAEDEGTNDDDGGDGDMQLATMADFRKCLKAGDDEGALGHLRDLMGMLSGGEEE